MAPASFIISRAVREGGESSPSRTREKEPPQRKSTIRREEGRKEASISVGEWIWSILRPCSP